MAVVEPVVKNRQNRQNRQNLQICQDRQDRRRRRWLRAVAVACAALSAAVATTLPAHANPWGEADNFDNPGLWRTQVIGQGSVSYLATGGSKDYNPGGGYAQLVMYGGTGYASTAHNIVIRPMQTKTWVKDCSASVALQGTGTVNLEVIDPQTWQYVALRKVYVNSSLWTTYTVGPWNPPKANLIFRVSLLKTNAASGVTFVAADGFTLGCLTSYD